MNLNKFDKAAIVRNIMADVPKPDQATVEKELQAALVKGMSAPVRKLYNAGNTKALRSAHFGSDVGLEWGKSLVAGDADAELIAEPFRQARREYNALKDRLRASIEGVRTRKQFVDRFPEFSMYAPAEPGKSTNLPAVANVVADLVKFGWVQKVSTHKDAA